VQRSSTGIHVSGPFARPVLNGVSTQAGFTAKIIMLYAQVAQLNNGPPSRPPPTVPVRQFRNVLLRTLPACPQRLGDGEQLPRRILWGEASIDEQDVRGLLETLGLRPEAPLCILDCGDVAAGWTGSSPRRSHEW
jgi:hypothetical protein